MSLLEAYLTIELYLLTEPDTNKRRAKIRAVVEAYQQREKELVPGKQTSPDSL